MQDTIKLVLDDYRGTLVTSTGSGLVSEQLMPLIVTLFVLIIEIVRKFYMNSKNTTNGRQ